MANSYTNWKAETPEQVWFSGSCAMAIQPSFAARVRSYRTPEEIAKDIEKLELSAAGEPRVDTWAHGALTCIIVEDLNLYKALRLREWRMVTRFVNPAHSPHSIVSMWIKPLVEELPLNVEEKVAKGKSK